MNQKYKCQLNIVHFPLHIAQARRGKQFGVLRILNRHKKEAAIK